MTRPALKSVEQADAHHEETANAVDAALNQQPSTRTLISRTQKSLEEKVAMLKERRSLIERTISDKRAELHQVNETTAALEAALGRLAETASLTIPGSAEKQPEGDATKG